MEILTINATAKKYNLPPFMLRSMQRQGTLPGFYSASRFYVNCDLLLQKIDADSRAAMSGGTDGDVAS